MVDCPTFSRAKIPEPEVMGHLIQRAVALVAVAILIANSRQIAVEDTPIDA